MASGARQARDQRFTGAIKPDIDEIMGRLSDAISVVATAAKCVAWGAGTGRQYERGGGWG